VQNTSENVWRTSDTKSSVGAVLECVMHHKQDVHTYNTHVAQRSNNRMMTSCDLYCCLLPQCEALHAWHLSIPITKPSQQRLLDTYYIDLQQQLSLKTFPLGDISL